MPVRTSGNRLLGLVAALSVARGDPCHSLETRVWVGPWRLGERQRWSTKNPGTLRHRGHAPRVGLEPTTYRLTAGRSTIELTGNQLHTPGSPDASNNIRPEDIGQEHPGPEAVPMGTFAGLQTHARGAVHREAGLWGPSSAGRPIAPSTAV